jgi:hypothetical protein
MNAPAPLARKKSLRMAYLLWAFLGLLFAHRLYLRPGKLKSLTLAVTMIVCMVAATTDIGLFSWVGLAGAAALFVVVLFDLFEISSWVKRYDLDHDSACPDLL